ncbi:MAG: hypothetical protein M3527_07420 [Actinomycetota bacterium]|nr:hypothetical protein [Acidimicrobiia bacterium]MDQ3294262.1 hypothetical protein [Actinomycetota bacterium]
MSPVALVTGAARPRGIGRATALLLAQQGHDVAGLDIARPLDHAPAYAVASGDDLNAVVAEIEDLGRRAVEPMGADMTVRSCWHPPVDAGPYGARRISRDRCPIPRDNYL